MAYSDKAFNIVKNSINSAIFIDDQAKDFYSDTQVNVEVIEEKLSKDLHLGFKSAGISLAVHKFLKSDIGDADLKQYLFKDRDLVLLDWELDDTAGEEYSLKLLSEVVNYSHINFCCIYTRSPRFNNIYSQIETYFSGYDNGEFDAIKKAFSNLSDKDVPKIKALLNLEEDELEEPLAELGIDLSLHPFKGDINFSSLDLLRQVYWTFLNNTKPEKKEPRANMIVAGSDNFIINNTFIFLLQKDKDNDAKPSFLLRKISDKLLDNQNSFLQLLGLEMQSIFNTNESFIDSNLLNSSTNALFSHRNHLKNINHSDIPFASLVKKVLLEHAVFRLRTSKLSLLDSEFLDEESISYSSEPTDEEIALINTFYNSVDVKSLNNIDLPNINFGDIFYDGGKYYYLCITALCDCLRPEKIKNNFYFARGEFINIQLANLLGDTAFISYLSKDIAVSWVTLESSKPKKMDNTGLSAEAAQINNLKAKVEALEHFKFKPAYIEPFSYNVKIPKIINNKIEVRRVETSKPDLKTNLPKSDDPGNINFINLEYVTTLRPDYTQRITNHCFMHPVRVGVDFVKK